MFRAIERYIISCEVGLPSRDGFENTSFVEDLTKWSGWSLPTPALLTPRIGKLRRFLAFPEDNTRGQQTSVSL